MPPKGRKTLCDKSLRHIVATSRLVCTDAATRLPALILSLRSIARIQTGLNSCDRSQRQNSVAATMIFTCHKSTPLFGLFGDVPLDRVWFFGLPVLNRVYNLTCLCPKQGQLSYTGYSISSRETLPRLRAVSFEVRLKEHGIERRTTSGAFLLLIFQ